MSSLLPVSTRHRTNMVTIFDVFCEIGMPDETGLPSILTKYPEDYNDETVLRSARQFSFPCGSKDLEIEAVQLFSFVLTDSEGKFSFGFCRYTPRNNTCLCIISGFAWDAGFYKILNQLSVVMNNSSQEELDLFLTKIYHTDIPNVGDIMNFDVGILKLEVQVPDLSKLPTLRDDKYMLEFFNAVSARQMIAIYASLLKERRIIFTSRKISQLSSCIYAAATLIQPMTWQFVFIPVLPAQLIDMIMAPMPFLIGVPKQVLANTSVRDLGAVVIVDLDEKNFESGHKDELPSEVSSYLRKALSNANDMGDHLSRSFLRATALLFGGYRLGFTRNESTGMVAWDREKYVAEQRISYQPYLSSLIGADGVQYLERFIEERLKALNSGVPKNDEFEKEITNIERNRPQVKESTTDVIGALKDKVTGIQISSKFNKLTPKEIRKAKNWTMRTSFSKNTAEPLSFDNIQWEDTISNTSSRSVSPKMDDVNVANLIDLDSPVHATDVAALEFDPLQGNPIKAPQLPPRQFLSQSSSPSSQYWNSSQVGNVQAGATLPPVPPRPQTISRSLNSTPLQPPARPPKPVIMNTANPFIDPFATPDASQPLSLSSFAPSSSAAPPSWEKFE